MAVSLVTAVVLELTWTDFRQWWEARPLFGGALFGGLLVGSLLFLLQRDLDGKAKAREQQRAQEEAERWRDPTSDTLDAYATVAKRTGEEVAEAIGRAFDKLDREREETTAGLIHALAAEDPQGFAHVTPVLHRATAECASHAAGVLMLLTLSPTLLEHRDRVSAVQRATLDMATLSEAVAAQTASEQGIERLATLASDRERHVAELVEAVRDRRS